MPHRWRKVRGPPKSWWVCEICRGQVVLPEGEPKPHDKVASPFNSDLLSCDEMQAWRVHAS